MNAEIIAVGSELLTARRLDTNSLYLTEQLNNLGVELTGKQVVGDDCQRLSRVVREALGRAEIIILTGGLGPTEDDVTREAVAGALARGLVFNEEILTRIAERFRRMDRPMAVINKRQAFVIEGAEALPNGNGTAPGLWIEHEGRVLMLLPGPPPELKPMFTEECVPRLERFVPKRVIRRLVFRVAGMGESDLDQLISPVYREYENPVTTVLAAPGDIQIQLRAQCSTVGEADSLLGLVGERIAVLLGDRIYSRNGDPMEAVVGEQLRSLAATLSVAESCTGGLLAGRITEVPGSSDYFLGGFLAYSNRMKTELLGVDPGLIEEHGAASESVAQAMASGARDRTGSTFSLSVTGIAGPSGATEQAPAGTVCVGVAHPAGCESRRFRTPGDRTRVRAVAVQTALDLLRRRLSR